MSVVDNKEREKMCLNVALKKGLFGYTVDTSRKDNGIAEDRPDFLLVKDGKKIGVEHFLVDTLLRNYKKNGKSNLGSLCRQMPDELKHIYDKYEKEKFRENADEACKDIEKELNLTVDRTNNFCCKTFESEFCNIIDSHVSKIDRYKSEGGVDKIGFICEADIVNPGYNWIVFKSNKNNLNHIVIKPIPLTYLMRNKIKEVLDRDDVVFFIIVAMQSGLTDYMKTSAVRCYRRNNIMYSDVYDSFRYSLNVKQASLNIV